MKKKLEADLISIAHRILQLKNKSDINQLYLESQKLYEKLSVLRFIDEHYGDVKPTIGHTEIEKEVQAFYDKSAELPIKTVIEITESKLHQGEKTTETITEEKTEPEIGPSEVAAHLEEVVVEENTVEDSKTEENTPEIEEEVIEDETVIDDFEADIKEQPVTEETPIEENVIVENNTEKDILGVASEQEKEEDPEPEFKAAFELTDENETEEVEIEEVEIETPKKPEAVQISFEDLLGGNYNDTLFVKVDDVPALPPEIIFEAKETIVEKTPEPIVEEKIEKTEPKTISLNDKLSKGIDIDLNDRIAFVKHLFGNSSEDYNRVLNQLITFDNFHETRSFIEEMVKPDYNNWKGKEDYEERFMDIIEKKFL